MDPGTQEGQGPAGPEPSLGGGPRPGPRQPPEAQGGPSLSIGPILARTARHFFPDLSRWIGLFPEKRRADRITYPAPLLLWYGVLLFAGRLGSRRQLDFKYRERGTRVLENLNRLAIAL